MNHCMALLIASVILGLQLGYDLEKRKGRKNAFFVVLLVYPVCVAIYYGLIVGVWWLLGLAL